jgi:type IV pilus assembly protein PilW
MKPSSASSPGRREQGLSLIELMISITLGMIVLASLITVFVNNSASRRDLDRSAGVLENGRYAIGLLNDDLGLAGYYGSLTTLTGTTDLPCSTTVSEWSTSLARPVHGSNHTGTTSGDLPCVTRKTNTDAIFIQRASSCVSGPTAETGCAGVAAGTAYLQVSECGDEYQTTKFRLSTDATTLTLKSIVLSTSGGSPTCSTTAATVAPIRKFYRSIYYVDSANILWRLDIDAASTASPPGTPVQIASGIESMQIEYGLDSNGDGAPDSFSSAPTAWDQVVGARVSLLVRADSSAPGYVDDKSYFLGDICSLPPGSSTCPSPYSSSTPVVRSTSDQAFRRHVFSSYVTFGNVVGRRQQ